VLRSKDVLRLRSIGVLFVVLCAFTYAQYEARSRSVLLLPYGASPRFTILLDRPVRQSLQQVLDDRWFYSYLLPALLYARH